jgi:hypothetical protein
MHHAGEEEGEKLIWESTRGKSLEGEHTNP